MIKILDRHIVADIAPTFLMAVVLFAGFILIAGGPLVNAINYLAQGAPFWLIGEIVSLYLPQMLVYAFPMAVLIAVILGFTRLSSDSEAVAMFAAGVSFYRMLVPTMVFAVLVTILGLYVSNSLMPAAQCRIDRFKADFTHEVQETTDPFPLPPAKYGDGKIQALVWVEGGFDAKAQALRRVTITEYDPKSGLPSATIYAQSARWLGGNNWELINTRTITDKGMVVTAASKVDVHDIGQKPADVGFLQEDLDKYSFNDLARLIATAKEAGMPPSRALLDAEVNLWHKIALPCASLVFALVGAPLALKPQRAATRVGATAIGIGIILGYYALFKVLEIVATNGQIDPVMAAFLPNLLGIGLAAYLISRVTT